MLGFFYEILRGDKIGYVPNLDFGDCGFEPHSCNKEIVLTVNSLKRTVPCYYHLAVRIPDFQSGNEGSIPSSNTKIN